MNNTELRKKLSLGEGGTLEVKKKYSKESFGRVICAFLNTKGGYLVLIPSSADCQHLPEYQEKIKSLIQNDIVPHTPIFVNVSAEGQPPALIVEVPEGLNKPYSFQNAFFLRKDDRSDEADIQEIHSMLLDQQVIPTRWERMFSDEIDPEMFSKDELKRLKSIIPFQDDDSLMRVLETMSLMRQGRLTNAADILLTENPAIRHPQIRVRAVCYVKKTDNQYKDYKIFEGPALQMMEEILHFIERNTPSQAVFTEGTAQREMRSQYPIKAIREGLVNAFAHRDYASYSGGIRVEIGRDSLAIWNSGTLPDGVTLSDLKSGHVSVLRNPDIANYFYRRGYMEMLGRGSILIQQECEKAGNKAPKWEVDDTGVTLTFFSARPMSGPMSGPAPEQGNSGTGPMSGPMSEELKQTIFQAEKENSKIGGVLKVLTIKSMSQSEMAEALSLKSVSGALKRAVTSLEKLQLIEKLLPDKARSRNQKYQLTNLGRQYLEETKP